MVGYQLGLRLDTMRLYGWIQCVFMVKYDACLWLDTMRVYGWIRCDFMVRYNGQLASQQRMKNSTTG